MSHDPIPLVSPAWNLAARLAFWECAALIGYAYALYPFMIWSCSRLFERRREPPAWPDDGWPSVTLLIAAYNEEAVIGQRVRNALEVDYPDDRFAVVVGSDGSDDRTAEI